VYFCSFHSFAFSYTEPDDNHDHHALRERDYNDHHDMPAWNADI